jgi:hypothetical protein
MLLLPQHAAWARNNPGAEFKRGLLTRWALEHSGLPALERRTLHVVDTLEIDGKAVDLTDLAGRIGIRPDTLRDRVLPALRHDGWTDYPPPGPGRRALYRFRLCLPVSPPPNRLHRPE